MVCVIQRANELPSQFLLSKYDRCGHFGLREWVISLEARFIRMFNLANTKVDERSALEESARCLIEYPMWPIDMVDKGCSERRPPIRKIVSLTRHVRDLDINDYLMGSVMLKSERLKDYVEAHRRYLDDVDSHADILNDPVWMAYRNVGYSVDRDSVMATVNLYGSEEQIVDDFRVWLRETRAALQIDLPAKRITEQDAKRWHEFRVLAYLDLTHWAALHNSKITHQAMGDALFPEEGVTRSERVRKVVMPLAKEVCHENFTDMLRTQVEAELEGRGIPVGEKFATWFVAPGGGSIFVPDWWKNGGAE